jgi:hypothetical protein
MDGIFGVLAFVVGGIALVGVIAVCALAVMQDRECGE